MQKITTAQLVEILEAKKGCEFAKVVCQSDAKLLKTGNTLGAVEKRSTMLVNIGWGYENAVNNQRLREGKEADFQAEGRKWGVRRNSKIVEHKGQLYVTMKSEQHFDTTFIQGDVILDKTLVEPFLPKRAKAETQELDKDVMPLDYKVSSIKQITLRGETYEIY